MNTRWMECGVRVAGVILLGVTGMGCHGPFATAETWSAASSGKPALVAPGGADHDGAASPREQALDILRRADAAARAVRHVSYDVRNYRVDGDDDVLLNTGVVHAQGWYLGLPQRFVYRIRPSADGGGGSSEIVLGRGALSYWVIDHGSLTAFVNEAPAVYGSATDYLRYFPVSEFVHPAPYDDEMKATELRYEGIVHVGSTSCYKVYAAYAGGMQQVTWFFAVDDLLPRRVDRVIQYDDGSTELRTSLISNLGVNERYTISPYRFDMPEHYEVTNSAYP